MLFIHLVITNYWDPDSLSAPDTEARWHCQPALPVEFTPTHLQLRQQQQFRHLGTFSREQFVHSTYLLHVLGNVCLETSQHLPLRSCFRVSDHVPQGTLCYREERRWLCTKTKKPTKQNKNLIVFKKNLRTRGKVRQTHLTE